MKNHQRIVISEQTSKYVFAPEFMKLKANRWAIARSITSQAVANELDGINESLLDERYLTMELEGEPYTYYLKKTIDGKPFELPESVLPPAPYEDANEFLHDINEMIFKRIDGAVPGLVYTLDIEWDDTWDEDARRVHIDWEEPQEQELWERRIVDIVESRGAALPVDLYVNLRGNGVYINNLIDVKGRGELIVRDGKLVVAWTPETLRTQSGIIKRVRHLAELGETMSLKNFWNGSFTVHVPFFDVQIRIDEDDKELREKVYQALHLSTPCLINDEDEEYVEEAD